MIGHLLLCILCYLTSSKRGEEVVRVRVTSSSKMKNENEKNVS